MVPVLTVKATIFPRVSKADPKHGRWILPLVVTALIGFTYVFVNALDAGTVPDSTTTTIAVRASTTTATATTTTTTTFPPAVTAFLAEVAGFRGTAADLVEEARLINEAWDATDAGFNETLAALRDLDARVTTFATEVNTASPPLSVSDDWVEVTGALDALTDSAGDMITGLRASDSGQQRRAALDAFEIAGASLDNGLVKVRSAISSS